MIILKTAVRALLVGAWLLLVAAPAPAQTAPPASTSGWITPTLTFFDFSKGFGDDLTQVLEQYDYRRALGGDRRSGALLDVGDLRMVHWSNGRPQWRVERRAASYDNHRGQLQFDTDRVRLQGGYGYLRTASDGVGYLYSPNRVRGGTDPEYAGGTVGFFRTFNDDSGQTLFRVGRLTTGASLRVKPEALADLGAIAVSVDRVARTGNRLGYYILGGGDTTGPADARAQLRWRAYDREEDHTLDTGRFQVTLSPRGAFTLDYQLSVDRLQNHAPDYTLGAVTSGIPFAGNAATEAFFSAGRETLPMQFVPNSGVISNRVNVTKRFGRTGVAAAGYGVSVLDQDTFEPRQTARGFTRGRITTDTAFASAQVRPSRRVGLEARASYANRSNESTFPVVGFYDPNSSMTQPRLNTLKRTGVGVEATIDPGLPRSTVALGYQRDTVDRDLSFGVGRGIQPARTLYSEATELDRLYLRFVTRPVKGFNVRLRASTTSGDKTGLITEPESATDVHVAVGYAAPAGGALSVFYGLRDRSNGLSTFTGGPAPGPVVLPQRRDATFASAGVFGSYAPGERAGATFSYVWSQTDVDTNFITTNIRRFDSATSPAAIIFTARQATQTLIDTHTLSLGGDVRASDRTTLSASYLVTAVRGDVASGGVAAALPVEDARADNTLHGLAVSADYLIKPAWTLRTTYVFDYYADTSFRELTGGRHSVMAGVVVGF